MEKNHEEYQINNKNNEIGLGKRLMLILNKLYSSIKQVPN